MSSIFSTAYLPSLVYFKKLIKEEKIQIEAFEHFQKQTIRNRCFILSANGIQCLTVPIHQPSGKKQLIKDVEIKDDISWQRLHWRALTASYNRSPFFEFYGAEIQKLIFAPNQYLFEHNLKIIEWFNAVLKLGISIGFTESYKMEYQTSEAMDYRNKWLPKNYARESNEWQPRYTQVFSDRFGFLPNLSVLDLLFCKGSL